MAFLHFLSRVLVASVLLLSACSKSDAPKGKGPAPVQVSPVVVKSMPLEVRNFGTVEPMASVQVKAQVNGILMAVHFKEGQDVKLGDPLFTIDPRPFDAALKQSQATLMKDQAQLKNAEKEKARLAKLLSDGFAAQGDYDQAETTVASLQAAIFSDNANIDNAKVQLEYCRIISPIDGKVGARLVDAGNPIKANDITLVVVNQLHPLRVKFTMPQQYLPELRKRMAEAEKTGIPLAVRVFPEGPTGEPEIGTLTFLDNGVDPGTGTILLKGTFPNTTGRLWPGQFVPVVLTLAVEENSLVVPAQAVENGQKGTCVYVIKPGDKPGEGIAELRQVTVRRITEGEAILTEGVAAGELVATRGQLKLVPNAAVTIQDPNAAPEKKSSEKSPEKTDAKSEGSGPAAAGRP